MKKTRRRFFYATNPEKDVAVITYSSGNTMLSSTRFGEAFASQVNVPGIEKLIALYPEDTLWQASLRNAPPQLAESLRDRLLVVLQPGPKRPPLVAFCRRRITRPTAEALLEAMPEISAVGCSEGLILRQGIMPKAPAFYPTPTARDRKEAAHVGH